MLARRMNSGVWPPLHYIIREILSYSFKPSVSQSVSEIFHLDGAYVVHQLCISEERTKLLANIGSLREIMIRAELSCSKEIIRRIVPIELAQYKRLILLRSFLINQRIIRDLTLGPSSKTGITWKAGGMSYSTSPNMNMMMRKRMIWQ
jgi:hypothetical protein